MRIIVCSSDVCSSDLLLLVAQVRALHQPLVQADRAVDLATPTEKMPQCNLGLEGVLVQLRDVQEQLDRLVRLFVEQVVQAAAIGRRQPADLGVAVRSEERRVGKEWGSRCSSRWWTAR